MSHKTVLLMAGGTGGHVFPALAIAESLRGQGVPIHWLGTTQGLEARVVPQAGIPISHIKIGGLRGKGIWRKMAAPFSILFALIQALIVLRRLKPGLVVGMGGFVTGPGGLAAWLLRIPLIIHEQNALPGLTNRLLARLATRVLQAFPDTFPARYQAATTGNPLRPALLQADFPIPRAPHSPVRILIVGGSLGARFLNETVPPALRELKMPLAVRHQTGKGQAEKVRKAYANMAADTADFIDNMAEAYAWADLVICRAGALTVGELAQAGLPALLVPFPFAVDDHQTHNARFLSDAGAALLLPQSELDAGKLAAILNELLADPARLSAMSLAAKGQARPEALRQISEICLAVL
jgi:UDP-N-acetylglucosamine--N-acetylmuramyl-(pentapeptide) pyrophosphoryl-undecaprenol N-acetylglucosamine transferase